MPMQDNFLQNVLEHFPVGENLGSFDKELGKWMNCFLNHDCPT